MIIEMKPRVSDAPDGRLCVQTIRTKLADVVRLLLVPQPVNVEHCAPLLEDAVKAIAQLERITGSLSKGDIQAVRGDLSRVRALLQQAADLHTGWARILGAAARGYTPAGDASSLEAPSRVSVQG